MSVLIKGVEMPKTCSGCDLERFDEYEMTHECPLIYNGLTNKVRIFDRRSDCPLVEVKTPHGRLIDADALEYELGASDRDIYCSECLNEAPTVIEAE